ncbi:chorismate mutase [Neisseria canis]|uniref:Chorismate mutase-related protein n=1 Tax=Neisseria canis TaxID=493 RepID=A0A448D913_9NEIS|nr:chorismate mutase [Neisseria canis]OSI12919.1 chorismate mutase [Neisseria canis]VEF01984.1 Chorismate mutase-related protein [Neisseria canis]
MIIVMQKHALPQSVAEVVAFIRSRGLAEHVSEGEERTIIGAVGDERVFQPNELERLPQVERAIRVLNDWRIISRETQAQDSVISVRGVAFGAEKVLNITTEPNARPTADAAYIDPFSVPDTPYADTVRFNEKEQIAQMREALQSCHGRGQPVLVRIRDVRQIEAALVHEADILYLGGELMANRMLQDEVGRLNTPLVLCKDKHHLYNEWLVAAERVALKGNHQIILGEAGTLSFEPDYPHRLDVDAVARVRGLSHLPVLANISGLWHNGMPQEVLYRLAVAAGANAVISSL